ncbi:MAG: DUF418 domain-containing protein [Proteobacteria bacterium]|nr:DUF418 domain-containing protein [Pseudomonadota bacterium]
MTQQTPAAGPVEAGQRIVSLDRLRGVAILGILVMNVYTFAMPFIGYMDPLRVGGTEPYNVGTWMFTHILFDQKFLSIFAMLFGAGLVLMTERAEARGAKPARFYFRRQFWLLVIGALHGYFIWFGDILFAYALIGMLVYRARKWQPRTLVILACLLLPVTLLFNLGNAKMMEQAMVRVAEIEVLQEAGEALDEEQQRILENWEQQRAFAFPTDEDIRRETEAYLGSYLDAVEYRAPLVAMMQVFMVLFYGLWRISALMLIGMALMKLGVLTADRSTGFYARFTLVFYALGLPLTVFSAVDLYAHEFDQLYFMRAGGVANYVGSIFVALGHIGLVMWLTKTGVLQRLMDRFAAVGRMALTNYLAHSVILTTVFYGYGLGLFGSVPRFWQMFFVAAVVGLQLLWSSWWLERYRFGPVEWVWRSLTYGSKQAMK